MLNEFTYCPRLFHLEWVQGEFVDNEFTVEGRHAHRRIEGGAGARLVARAEPQRRSYVLDRHQDPHPSGRAQRTTPRSPADGPRRRCQNEDAAPRGH
ncbi:MAG TPA: hypothetical protein VLT61_15700 [Anaeromyxobacteraceae bacterium]|nr:hypothetical protein [Anaeromyxobacteraceae bacterium]